MSVNWIEREGYSELRVFRRPKDDVGVPHIAQIRVETFGAEADEELKEAVRSSVEAFCRGVRIAVDPRP